MSSQDATGAKSRGIRGTREVRLIWTDELVNYFVNILREFNLPRYRGQNGWVKEGWNAMAERMNQKFPSLKIVVSQLKDREQRLKKEYNVVKLLLSKSGFGWDPIKKMATTIDEKWEELPKDLQKFKDKSFPHYDTLDEIYNGKVAGGKNCRRTTEKVSKPPIDLVDKEDHMTTPSPPMRPSGGGWADFFPDELNFKTHSQYRLMTEEQADMEGYTYRQFSPPLEPLNEVETQAARDAQAEVEAQVAREAKAAREVQAREAQAGREAQHERDARPKKNKRNSDTSMDELIALRREELEAYKDLTEKQIELKQRKIERFDPSNDPFSMTKCMEKLKLFDFSKEDKIEAIKFLKGDREAREIFIGCDEKDLADAYIRGSIAP